MHEYYVNTQAQANGDHEVHVKVCAYFPRQPLRLGVFERCHDAVAEAKRRYPKANGCYWCCRACHTR